MDSFKGKKVLIMGLGINGGGAGSAAFFCRQKADVLVTDLKNREQLKDSVEKLKKFKVKYSLGGHQEEDVLWADMIIKNPDVPNSSPYLQLARNKNIPIETDVSLFFKHAGAFIIGVTGTKGKSTTSSLIHHMLKCGWQKAFLAGNIGISPLELLPKVKPGDKVVLELSSFELEDLDQSPHIAVITNIYPDHLNRYASMEEYIEAKKRIFKFQTKNDYLVMNGYDSIVRQMAEEAKSKVVICSKAQTDNPRLQGEYNSSNIAAAVEAARIAGVKEDKILKAIKSFKGVPSRQEFVREVRGVKYFNDTTATIPEAVIAAIENFSSISTKVFLICGGVYKGVEYRALAKKIQENSVELIMFPGSGSEKLKERLPENWPMHHAGSMQEAVAIASQLSKKGELVALSPGASSFNMFKNEFDRGAQFVQAVKKIK